MPVNSCGKEYKLTQKPYYPGTKRLLKVGDHVRFDPIPGSVSRTGFVARYWEANPLARIRKGSQFVVQIVPDKYQREIKRERDAEGFLNSMLEFTHPID